MCAHVAVRQDRRRARFGLVGFAPMGEGKGARAGRSRQAAVIAAYVAGGLLAGALLLLGAARIAAGDAAAWSLLSQP